MYISLNWIKEYVDLSGIDERQLINKFTLSTAEVEGMEYKGANVKGVIVGKIEEINNHPKSNKLHLLKVNDGHKLVDVVCGAPNVLVGMKVPFAVSGATVGDMHIEPATVGGYVSYGMCCSAKELGISDDNSGLMKLPDDWTTGADIKQYLDIDDVVFEVDNKSLTNRPDLWGHYGIAREIAALVGRPLRAMPVYDGKFGTKKVQVKVSSPDCYRYTSVTVDNITAKTSPLNMQIRLYYTGMRALNLLADLTNYIMLECGQPMHAFDNAIVKNIEVLNVAKDTPFTTLDDNKRTLPKGTMVITSAGEPVAVAGVMGGLDSEITDATASVLVESANFNGAPVRKTAQSLGLRTESSARYEKMLDPELTKTALLRYLYLLKQSDPNVKITSALTDVYNYHYPKLNVEITKQYIDKFVGVDIPESTILNILKSLEFGVTANRGKYTIDVPTFRATKDINGKQDIVEEITRIYGYDNLPAISTEQKVYPVTLDRNVATEYDVKYLLATKYGMHETHSYIWYDTETNKQLHIEPTSVIGIANALNKENSQIRNTMLPTMLKVVLDNKGSYDKFGAFEIGRVVRSLNDKGLANETKSLGIVLYDKAKDQNQLLLQLKDMLEYVISAELKLNWDIVPCDSPCDYISPANCYNIVIDGKVVGVIGLIHPRTKQYIDKNASIVMAELDFSAVLNATPNTIQFAKVSKFPVTGLDFTFVVPSNMLYSDISKIAHSLTTPLNYQVTLKDIYGDQVKSYTIHYDICLLDRTLSTSDIEEFHKCVINTFADKGINLKM